MFQAIVNPRESAVGATRHTFPPPWGVHQDCPVLAAWKRSSNYKVITEEFGVPWAIAILRDFEGTIRSWLVELKTKTNVSGWSFQMDVDDHEPKPGDTKRCEEALAAVVGEEEAKRDEQQDQASVLAARAALMELQAKDALSYALLYFLHYVVDPGIRVRVEREAALLELKGKTMTWGQAKAQVLWGRRREDPLLTLHNFLKLQRQQGEHLVRWLQICTLKVTELKTARVNLPSWTTLATRQMTRDERTHFSAEELEGEIEALRVAAEKLPPESFHHFHPRMLRDQQAGLSLFFGAQPQRERDGKQAPLGGAKQNAGMDSRRSKEKPTCTFCSKVGHEETNCYTKDPSKKPGASTVGSADKKSVSNAGEGKHGGGPDNRKQTEAKKLRNAPDAPRASACHGCGATDHQVRRCPKRTCDTCGKTGRGDGVPSKSQRACLPIANGQRGAATR